MTSTAYTRDDNGTLRQIQVMCMADEPGQLNIGAGYNPCRVTRAGQTRLAGWGTDDGEADVYRTDAGLEVIVPERIKARVSQHLAD